MEKRAGEKKGNRMRKEIADFKRISRLPTVKQTLYWEEKHDEKEMTMTASSNPGCNSGRIRLSSKKKLKSEARRRNDRSLRALE